MPMNLDDAYANGAHIAGAETYPQRWATAAEAYRKRLSVAGRARLGLMYGPGTRHVMDLFLPDGGMRGLVVFLHGGYWLRFDRESWSHLAEGARAQGWAVAMPSYDLCPEVRISDITRQVAKAISAAAAEVPGPIRLAGHSAGGHLAARMGAKDMLPSEVSERIETLMLISPLVDLEPLMRTSMNADLRIDAAEARRESPINMPAPKPSVCVWVGGDERPAFLEQASKLEAAWSAQLVVDPHKHHFDVIEGLADPQSPMVARLLSRQRPV